jgi:molybdate transport system substrate-binding protein
MIRYFSNVVASDSGRRYSFASLLSNFCNLVLVLLLTIIPIAACSPEESGAITTFCGSASKPPLEESARAFRQKTGITVYLNFGGSGSVLSQMKLSGEGDLYIPGSPDYIVIAERDGIVEPGSAKIIAYLVPAIVVQPGNSKNIKSLSDLTVPGIKVGIGNPGSVCLGLYSIEILERNKLLEPIAQNIVTYAESCEKVATLVALKAVDAVIGWDVFSAWNSGAMELVYLKPEQIPRIAYIPAAISKFSRNRESTAKFMNFLTSEEGRSIFSKWGYLVNEKEARRFAPDAAIGGEYKLPVNYKPLVK